MIDYKGSDPVAFVRSANWHRRHLSASQRALAQVQLSEWAAAGNQPKGAILHPPLTVSQMATTAGVSERSIQHARRVDEAGSPALKTALAQVQLSEWVTEGKRSDTPPNGGVKTESEMAAEAKVSEWVLPSRHSGAELNSSAKTKAEMAKEAGVGTTTIKHATTRF